VAVLAFAQPDYASLHLHDRLQVELTHRGHQCVGVFTDAVAERFWHANGFRTIRCEQQAVDALRVPIREFAIESVRRADQPEGTARHRRAVERTMHRLQRLVPGALAALERTAPDLVVLRGPRCAERRVLDFLARELGSRVLWLGDGLLPHTICHDESGIDADAAITRRIAADYRDVTADTPFLESCIAHLAADDQPCALSRRPLRKPPRHEWRGALWQLAREQGLARAWRARSEWLAAARPPLGEPRPFALPPAPFATVLLQHPDDDRVRIDSPAAPTPEQLVVAADHALTAAGIRARLAVVLPDRSLPAATLAALRICGRVDLLPAAAAVDAAMTGLVVFTISHPTAVGALLTATPVVHTGRALFGLPGVTHRAPSASFAEILPSALLGGGDTLRRRFLTALLRNDHLWCSPTHPDHNGVLGLANAIESQLGRRSPRGTRLPHRAGPPWPLAAHPPT
jgi:hypothetical protein